MENGDKDHAAPKVVTSCEVQPAVGNTKTAQCATGNTKSPQFALENTAQLAVVRCKTLQGAEGHAKQSSTSNDMPPEDVNKKADDRVDERILNKNTALKAKNKKRGKKCIIL